MKFLFLILVSLVLFPTNCSSQTAPENIQNTSLSSSNESYDSKLKSIETERQKLFAEYQTSTDKKAVLEKARQVFVSSIDEKIFPDWYGTDWDFYGTTQIPRTGKIACGYFVTTVLRDAGVRVQRVSLAQQASEKIVKSLTTEPYIKRFRNVPIENFVRDIKTFGAGLYVVGLDNHVGFILNDGAEVYFVHSSYIEPSEVIREKASTSPILSSSKYRVIGNISGDEKLIVKWLNQTQIPTLR